MFENKSLKFRAALKTARTFGMLTLGALLIGAIIELFGGRAILIFGALGLVYLILNMVYHSYLATLRQEEHDEANKG